MNSEGYLITQWKLDSYEHFVPRNIKVRNGKVYVLYQKRYAHRDETDYFLRIFTTSGQLLGELPGVGNIDLGLDKEGNLYVLGFFTYKRNELLHNMYKVVHQYHHHRLTKISPEGQVLASFNMAIPPDTNEEEDWTSMDIGNNGYVYVVDRDDHLVHQYLLSETGITYINSWGTWNGNDILFKPKGITVDEENNVYITDMHNNRILKFDEHGNFIFEHFTLDSVQKEAFQEIQEGIHGNKKIEQSKLYQLVSTYMAAFNRVVSRNLRWYFAKRRI